MAATKTRNMTEGSPLKLILAFMFPVLCGNIFQNFYNIVDSMIVGQVLGVDALAAVGSTSSINFLVNGLVIGMTSGFGIMIAQAFGANDTKRLKHFVAMSTYLCIALAVLMTTTLLLANHQILVWMNTPDKIFPDTKSYIGVIYAGLPVAILYNMLASTARALGDSKTPLYFLVLSSVLNIILDYVFVAILPFGVAGAAYATVLSQMVSAITCFFYVYRKYEIIHFSKADTKIVPKSLGILLTMGVPMALQFSITAIGTMIVQSSLNLLGSTYIASYSATMKIQNIVTQLYVALGSAMATYVGQNYGARKIKRISQGVKWSLLVVVLYSFVIMLLSYFVLPGVVKIFVEDPTGELQRIAKQMFHISLWFYIPLGMIFIYRNALQGLGNGFVPMMGGVFELFARGAIIFLLFDAFQFDAICWSDPGAWISALIPLIPYYYWYVNKLKKKGETANASTIRP